MKEDFLDKRKIITMAKDLKEAAGIMVYPREDDSIDLSSFIVKKPPQKESVVLEIPLPEKVAVAEEEQTDAPEEEMPVEVEEVAEEEIAEKEQTNIPEETYLLKIVTEEEQTNIPEETMPVEEVAEEKDEEKEKTTECS
jgi:hypothetical protein